MNDWSKLTWIPVLNDVILCCDQQITQNEKKYAFRALAIRRDCLTEEGLKQCGDKARVIQLNGRMFVVTAHSQLLDDPNQLKLSL